MQAFWVSLSCILCFSIFFPFFLFFFGCILCLSTKGLTEQNSTCCLHHPYIHNLYVLTRLNRANSFNIHIVVVSNVGHPGDACAAHRTRSIISAKCPGTCATGAGRAPCVWWRIDTGYVSDAWPDAIGRAGSARCCSRACSVPAGRDHPLADQSLAVAARSCPLWRPVWKTD